MPQTGVRNLIFCLAAFLVSLFGVPEGFAVDIPDNGPVDAVLVLDASGSMLLTDPQLLRLQGAKLFTQFLGKDDRLAVVGFSRDAKVLRPLEAFNAEQSEKTAKIIDSIGSQGEFTDLLSGIKAAKELLDSSARENARRIIVVLSDGKMEPDPSVGSSEARTAELVNGVLPELKANETKIYTLAFSDQADTALLAEMSGATDGLNWFTPTSEKIHESFANLFLVVKKPQVVPLTSKGFKLDDEIDEATFYINKEESPDVMIVSPDGEELSSLSSRPGLRWFSGQKFEVVTITNPAPGDWQVKGVTSTDGFATVLTDLQLIAQWPSTLRVDEPVVLEARLFDSQKPVALPEMSGVVKFGFQITPTDKISEPIRRSPLFDDGTQGDKIEGDGVLSHEVSIETPGEYVLSVVAKGPTFQRTQQIPFRVKPRLITLRIESGDEAGGHAGGKHAPSEHEEHSEDTSHGEDENSSGHEESHESEKAEPETEPTESAKAANNRGIVRGSPKDVVVVELSSEANLLKEVRVTLTARDEKRRKFDLPLHRDKGESTIYEFSAAGFPEDGMYELQAFFEGVGKRKEVFEAETEKLRFHRTSSKDDVSQAVLVVEAEKHEDAPAENGFPFMSLAIVTAVNGALLFGGLKFVAKLQAGPSVKVEQYSPPDSILAIIAELDRIAGLTALEPNDPIFKAALEADSSHSEATGNSDAEESEPSASGESTETSDAPEDQ